MNDVSVNRSFTAPVFFLLAGVLLALLAVAWAVFGTGSFISDDAAAIAEPNRPWLPLTAGLLSIAAFWAGFRALARRHS